MNVQERKQPKRLTGKVISDKMEKTITVKVSYTVQHPFYKKYISRSSVFKAHDEKNEAEMGDRVTISASKPLSKTKRWKLDKVVEKVKVKEGE